MKYGDLINFQPIESVIQLLDADEAFLTSTAREVLPVGAIDDRSFQAPGPVTRATAEIVGAWIRAELAAVT